MLLFSSSSVWVKASCRERGPGVITNFLNWVWMYCEAKLAYTQLLKYQSMEVERRRGNDCLGRAVKRRETQLVEPGRPSEPQDTNKRAHANKHEHRPDNTSWVLKAYRIAIQTMAMRLIILIRKATSFIKLIYAKNAIRTNGYQKYKKHSILSNIYK